MNYRKPIDRRIPGAMESAARATPAYSAHKRSEMGAPERRFSLANGDLYGRYVLFLMRPLLYFFWVGFL